MSKRKKAGGRHSQRQCDLCGSWHSGSKVRTTMATREDSYGVEVMAGSFCTWCCVRLADDGFEVHRQNPPALRTRY